MQRAPYTTPGPRWHRVSLTQGARLAAAAWAAVVFGFSSLPGSSVPGRFGTAAHFVEYAILGALLFVASTDRRDRVGTFILALALASAWGVTDELHQSFVTLRVPDVLDWIVDTCGAAAGSAVLAAVTSRGRLDPER